MKAFILIVMIILGIFIASPSFSQCTTSPYGQFPTTAYTPIIDNGWYAVTTSGYAGEYSVVNVVSGQLYRFRCTRNSNGASRYVTITNSTGTVLVHGLTTTTSSISWTATYTGTIRYYTHNNSTCGTGTTVNTRYILGYVPPPVNDDPSGAITLILNDPLGYKTFSNAGSTLTTGVPAPGCAALVAEDVWFKLVVPSGVNTIDIDTQPDDITDGGMAVYRGTPASLTLVECDDDDGIVGLMPWIFRTDYIPGETLYIRFWAYNASEAGNFKIYASNPTPLPIELISFEATTYPLWNVVSWKTATEFNSSHFILEVSEDAISWKEICNKQAAGNSVEIQNYSFIDYNQSELVYYRLTQYDFDGKSETFNIISATKFISEPQKQILGYYNLIGQKIDPNRYEGVVVVIYTDGTSKKFYR